MIKSLVSVCLWLAAWTTAWAGTTPRHTRVTWHQQAAHEAFISWSTDDRGKQSKVYYDTEARGGKLQDYRFQIQPRFEGRFKKSLLSKATPYYHHTKLEQLQANTAYHFVVVTDGKVSSEYWFRTAPEGKESVELLFGGDSRSDRKQRGRMNQLMKQLLETNPNILALVHGGDYVFDGSQWQEWEDWLDDQTMSRTDDKRLLPIVPTRGNHEIDAELFNEVFAWPGEGSAYYTTDLGPLSVVTLNTEISHYGDQQKWLDAELEKLRRVRPWIVANYHRPAYPAVKSPGAAKGAWVPLFEKHQVDLVFESDGHVFKQTVPIYKDRLDEARGIIYVGEGGLGVRQRTPDLQRWYLKGTGYAVASHHIQILTATAQGLNYTAINENSEILRQLNLAPRRLLSKQ